MTRRDGQGGQCGRFSPADFASKLATLLMIIYPSALQSSLMSLSSVRFLPGACFRRVVSAANSGFGGIILAALVASLMVGCVSEEPEPQQVAGLPNFAPLVEANAGSVINITGVRGLPSITDGQGGHGGFNQWFDGLFGEGEAPGPMLPQESDGSGFILSSDGYVATNAHVIEGAKKIFVRLADGRELAAELVGIDEIGDVALLKVDAQGLSPVTLGDSDEVRAGQWAVAIGSPYGFDQTVTAGVISGLRRTLPSETNQPYVPFIQSDVAINPGNSGGPLFNTRGQVIGINAQIFTESGAYNGISFAIPINYVVDVIAQIKQNGEVRRGFLGVEIRSVDRRRADQLGLPRAYGAEVTRFVAGSPAAHSALKVGDIILSVNGMEVSDGGDLTQALGALPPGSEVRLDVHTGQSRQEIVVRLAALPESTSRTMTLDPALDQPELVLIETLGLILRKTESGGVRIGELDPSGPASLAGLMPGDVVVSIDRQEVHSLAQAYQVLARIAHARGDELVLFLVERDGEQRFFMPAFSGNPHQSD